MDHDFPREALDLRDALGPARHHELQREVLDADFLVAADSFGDLLRRAVEAVLFPLERLFRDLDRQAAVQANIVWISPRLLRRAPHVVEAALKLPRRRRRGEIQTIF